MDDKNKNVEHVVKELTSVFKAQGADKIYTSMCCERVYVGLQPATQCRTCLKPVEVVERVLA